MAIAQSVETWLKDWRMAGSSEKYCGETAHLLLDFKIKVLTVSYNSKPTFKIKCYIKVFHAPTMNKKHLISSIFTAK